MEKTGEGEEGVAALKVDGWVSATDKKWLPNASLDKALHRYVDYLIIFKL